MSVINKIVGFMGTTATLTEVVHLSRNVLRLRMNDESIKELNWSPGNTIKLHVGKGAMRDYTLSKVNTKEGWLEIILHLHPGGVASTWASNLQQGEVTSFMGPSKSMKAVTESMPWTFFFGDETTLGLAQALHSALPLDTSFQGIIEVAASDINALETMPFPVSSVLRQNSHGAALFQYLEGLSFPKGEGRIWLSGEAGTVVGLRKMLLKRGIKREQLLIKPYWKSKR